MTDSINVSLGFSISLAGQRVRTGFDLYVLFPSKFSWKKSIFRSIFEDLWAPLVSLYHIQGVSQYFGHLEICNFSASGVPRIAILDIFGKPGQF